MSIRMSVVLAASAALALSAATPAVAEDAPPGSPPTATADLWTLVPTLQAEIPVLANDTDPDGDTLRIVSHTDPTYGSVTCGDITCTYVPPVRPLPSPDSDTPLSPEKPDSFTYTVADTTDRSATALVQLQPVVPSKHSRTLQSGHVRCAHIKAKARRRKSRSGTGHGGIPIGVGGAQVHVARKCRHATRRHSKRRSSKPPATPRANEPLSLAGRSLGATATVSPFVSGLRYGCSFKDTGSQGIGQFSIRSWIGENGATGVDRLTLGYRVQIYGTNFYRQASWVTVNVNGIATDLHYPDSWSTWLPGNKDFAWLGVPWGNADYAVQHGPFRLQIRTQWLHRRSYGDKLIKQNGWGTLPNCQGQPEP
jgi:hypothetical protein